MTADRVTGIVLAGGRSSRFGRDKLAEPMAGGGTLLDRAVGALAGLVTDIVVVAAPDVPAPAVGSAPAPVRVVHDTRAGRGPLVGLAAGIEAAPNPIVLVVGGDMPGLVPDVLRLLVDEVEAGAAAAALEEGGRLRPLPSALDRPAALRAVDAALKRGDSSLVALMAALDAVVVPEDVWRALDPHGRSLLDVDRRADLDRLRALDEG